MRRSPAAVQVFEVRIRSGEMDGLDRFPERYEPPPSHDLGWQGVNSAVGVLVYQSLHDGADPVAKHHPRLGLPTVIDRHDAAHVDQVVMGRIVPIYHGRETKTRMMLGDRIRAIMKGLVDQYADGAVDPLPAEIVRGRRLIAFGEAIKAVHFPTANANLEDLNRGRTPAHRRFAFEDFFLLELALGQKRESVEREARSVAYDQETLLPRRCLDSLPFRLTDAQSRVLQDIRRDLAGPHPMNRF